MKKFLLASSALMVAGSAFAADIPARMPLKAQISAPVPYSWTGCYIGAQVGYGWGTKDFSDANGFFAPAATTVRDNVRGGLAGGQVGCNYQFASNWVVGIEGEYAWANIKGDAVADPFFNGKNQTFSSKTDALASVTGRVGYAFDRVLLYGKGGAAWAHDRYHILLPAFLGPALDFTGTETRLGWTLGAGLEWAFLDSWSAKIEIRSL